MGEGKGAKCQSNSQYKGQLCVTQGVAYAPLLTEKRVTYVGPPIPGTP